MRYCHEKELIYGDNEILYNGVVLERLYKPKITESSKALANIFYLGTALLSVGIIATGAANAFNSNEMCEGNEYRCLLYICGHYSIRIFSFLYCAMRIMGFPTKGFFYRNFSLQTCEVVSDDVGINPHYSPIVELLLDTVYRIPDKFLLPTLNLLNLFSLSSQISHTCIIPATISYYAGFLTLSHLLSRVDLFRVFPILCLAEICEGKLLSKYGRHDKPKKYVNLYHFLIMNGPCYPNLPKRELLWRAMATYAMNTLLLLLTICMSLASWTGFLQDRYSCNSFLSLCNSNNLMIDFARVMVFIRILLHIGYAAEKNLLTRVSKETSYIYINCITKFYLPSVVNFIWYTPLLLASAFKSSRICSLIYVYSELVEIPITVVVLLHRLIIMSFVKLKLLSSEACSLEEPLDDDHTIITVASGMRSARSSLTEPMNAHNFCFGLFSSCSSRKDRTDRRLSVATGLQSVRSFGSK